MATVITFMFVSSVLAALFVFCYKKMKAQDYYSSWEVGVVFSAIFFAITVIVFPVVMVDQYDECLRIRAKIEATEDTLFQQTQLLSNNESSAVQNLDGVAIKQAIANTIADRNKLYATKEYMAKSPWWIIKP